MARAEELIVDDRERGIFRVNRRAFTDPEILEYERREIFDRAWLYAGHESEIAEPGDFATRYVGGRPIILVRDAAGTPRAFLNTCPHRGNIVCRERAGSTKLLRCFYHAWAFDLSGRLAGVPDDQSYTPAFDRDGLGLKPVPRFELYRGMMFLSFDAAIESLPSYLGNAREYLDLMLEFGGEECEIVPGSQAYSMKANWKLLIENSIDGYHALPTHQRYFSQYLADIGMDPGSWSGANRIQGIGLALEGGQRGFAAWRELSWSDISRGMGKDQPSSQDELQMRAFWRRWHALMQGRRGPTDCSDRAEQRAAAE